MSAAKHTQGSWNVVTMDRGFIITAKDGQYDVAVVRNIGNEDNAANARVIAAAPELLEAAEEAVGALNGAEHALPAYVVAALERAIAKATGEPNHG